MPGLWEFPGGKCERGETPATAAARECLEEAGIPVTVERLRMAITHRYPHGLLELSYFDCRLADASAQPALGSGFSWVPAARLQVLAFPEANERVLAELGQLAAGDGQIADTAGF
jgi:8-oxo-dGTP diphosphatase